MSNEQAQCPLCCQPETLYRVWCQVNPGTEYRICYTCLSLSAEEAKRTRKDYRLICDKCNGNWVDTTSAAAVRELHGFVLRILEGPWGMWLLVADKGPGGPWHGTPAIVAWSFLVSTLRERMAAISEADLAAMPLLHDATLDDYGLELWHNGVAKMLGRGAK